MAADLATAIERAHPRLLLLFDLDGFKQYNDTFGHPAGDMLLRRLGQQLQAAVAPDGGIAYRMGGDEFCVLVPAEDPERVVWTAWSALTERGEAFEIGSSYGVAEIPAEATSVKAALHIADVRLYDDKAAGRPSADRQSTDVLMALIHERGADLLEHVERVAQLTELTAKRVGLSDADARQAALAARLHDVGMTAIPETIVGKSGGLDPAEWAFIHRHTVIGERIIRAAPALVGVAEIVRSSHERFDGTGYPDRLRGDAIPAPARISVCDAYDTMTTEWVYQARVTPAEGLAELRACAGTQFDPAVVDAFCSIPAVQHEPAERHAA